MTNIPNLKCKIIASSTIYTSEDPQKVKYSIDNIILNAEVKISLHNIYARSNTIDSLLKIYNTIFFHNKYKIYETKLHNNLHNNNTWLYMNKQAAYANSIVLCNDIDESPLGPIKISIFSDDIMSLITWLTKKLN
ncbi:MAG: hypothetical protein OXF28_02005 [Thaumarchaeota archaeon]|nr:hypothetical protein [Nitrososphaerota archaeon]MCY3975890.1 hypothetical protein [Nitrososphaerota archaeon]